jgi:hemin uptake protein HemP
MKKNSPVEESADHGDRLAINPDHLVSGMPSRIFSSEELFQSEAEIGIVHQGSMYRLRVTRGGKLILNK